VVAVRVVTQLLAGVVQIHNLHQQRQPLVVAVVEKMAVLALVLTALTAVQVVEALLSQPQEQAQPDKETMEQQVQHQVA
jgi:hypothetical protein